MRLELQTRPRKESVRFQQHKGAAENSSALIFAVFRRPSRCTLA